MDSNRFSKYPYRFNARNMVLQKTSDGPYLLVKLRRQIYGEQSVYKQLQRKGFFRIEGQDLIYRYGLKCRSLIFHYVRMGNLGRGESLLSEQG